MRIDKGALYVRLGDLRWGNEVSLMILELESEVFSLRENQMSQNSTDKTKPAARANVAPEGNVDQIRDILFGGQMRDYERRFDELDERSKREAERARAEFIKRFESIEQLLKEQADKHTAQLKKLDLELKASAEAAAVSSERLAKALRSELTDVDEKYDVGTSALRDRVHKLTNETAESLRSSQNEISAVIDRMGTSLRDEKVARDELAGFFSEMALRLTRQFDLPKPVKA